jgi:branched-chain amino acid transport system permease protein
VKYNPSRTSVLLIVLVTVLVVLPFAIPPYYVDVLTVVLINAILVESFRFIALMGEFNFAHVNMMGWGAYTTAIMVKRMGLPWEVSLPMAGLVPAAIALTLSYPLLRMKGFYFFIGSFAAGEVMRLSWLRFDFFGRHIGIERIPRLSLPGVDLGNLTAFYFLALTVAVVSLLILYRLEHSRIGNILKSIAAQDFLAQGIGINLWRYKTLAFVTGCFFAGIAGFLFAHRLHNVAGSDFLFTYNLYVLVWAVFGGLGSFAGPLIGLATLSGVNEAIHAIGRLETWSPLIYGFILIGTLLFMPSGIITFPKGVSPVMQRLRMFWGRRRVGRA